MVGTQFFGNRSAFAAVKPDGSLLCWGAERGGGRAPVVKLAGGARQLAPCREGFVAVKADGKVVAWGDVGDVPEMGLVKAVFATDSAFAALKVNGSVVTWGQPDHGGDSSKVADELQGVAQIFANREAFAALRHDGSVVCWGKSEHGGHSPELSHVETIVASSYAFAALRRDRSVVSWGGTATSEAVNEVRSVFASGGSFAALKMDGGVVTWGGCGDGGDSSKVQDELHEVIKIFSISSAFAALRKDGRVVTWGGYLGNSEAVQEELVSVKHIYSTMNAFAALKADGTLVTWGARGGGGASDTVANELRDVKRVFHTLTAFAALTARGRVVTWGDAKRGGDSEAVKQELCEVKHICATEAAFLALKGDGVVTWGDLHAGGDCPETVKKALQTPVKSKRGLRAKVQVFWEGEWYEAEITDAAVKKGKDRVKVHYVGYASDWDEWLGMERLKSKYLANAVSQIQDRWPVGSRVEARFSDGKFYAAEVLQVSTSKKRAGAPVKVHWIGHSGSDWLSVAQLRSRAKVLTLTVMLYSQKYVVKTKSSAKLSVFRAKLHQECQTIPLARQSLRFGQVTLGDDEKTLAEYGVKDKSIIELRDLMD